MLLSGDAQCLKGKTIYVTAPSSVDIDEFLLSFLVFLSNAYVKLFFIPLVCYVFRALYQ